MFCPNCGRDCGDARFCSACGTQVQQGSSNQSSAQENRIRCPWCSSLSVMRYQDPHIVNEHLFYRTVIGKILSIVAQLFREKQEKLYGHSCECLECGQRWHPKMIALEKRHWAYLKPFWKEKPGVAWRLTSNHTLQLDEGGITLDRSEKGKCSMSYYELAAIDYNLKVNYLYGRLTFRDVAHRRKPFPKNLEQAKRDKYTLFFRTVDFPKIAPIYSALQKIIEENKKAGLLE